MTKTRWLFADQLGPHYLDDSDQPVLLVESKAVFRRRRIHRQKAHLVLSALRHRARDLGDRATVLQVETYDEALAAVTGPLECVHPTTKGALRFVESRGVTVLPDRGFATSREDFAAWAGGRKRLLMEDFYRWQRARFEVLMEGSEPVGGRWNFDHDNREAPPRSATLGAPEPWWPQEDEIDEEVRADLDRWERDGEVSFLGVDGPRWLPATRDEAVKAAVRFMRTRLAGFGPHEDAMLAADPWMSHSVLSPAQNLGLLHPSELVRAAEREHREGRAPLASVEGYVRQVLGWREWIWSVYWHIDDDYRHRNALAATTPLPDWWWELDADAVTANCLSSVLRDVRDRGWVHHIPRLMVLGGYALQRGIDPEELTRWFHQAFVDGYDWVMLPNVVGMSQHADGGLMATKPYASGGAYIDRMSDYCTPCAYDPKVRVGPTACPFTAGYWAFLDRDRELLAGNHRMRQPLAGLDRLRDREALVEQEQLRGTSPP
ncbi:MAG: cryptochrome/photolyase family protein [Mycobacteriales bacterium]|nr:cryptochrome/photolyase family protein [Mycobacteriales bacterium]